MKHYFTSFLIVILCYGVGFYSPAAEAKASRFNYSAARSYVNGKQRKSVKSLLTKFESSLPSDLYEDAMKKMGKKHGNVWFSSAKMGSDYVYMRIGKVKLFARSVEKNGQTYVLVNGEKLTPNHFRNYRQAQTVIMRAFYKEAFSKKGLFSFLTGFKAFAAQGEAVDPDEGAVIPEGPPVIAEQPYNDQCRLDIEAIISMPQNTPAQKQECERAINNYKNSACQQIYPFPNNGECAALAAAPSGDDQKKLGILLGVGALALILFLMFKNKKDKKKDNDDDDDDDDDDDTPEEVGENEGGVGGRPITCEGDEASCGDSDGGGTYPDPPTYYDGVSSDEPYPDTGSNSNINVNTSNNSNSGSNSNNSGNSNAGNNTSEVGQGENSSGGVGRGTEKLRRARVKTGR